MVSALTTSLTTAMQKLNDMDLPTEYDHTKPLEFKASVNTGLLSTNLGNLRSFVAAGKICVVEKAGLTLDTSAADLVVKKALRCLSTCTLSVIINSVIWEKAKPEHYKDPKSRVSEMLTNLKQACKYAADNGVTLSKDLQDAACSIIARAQ
jgi:hypothetical protein